MRMHVYMRILHDLHGSDSIQNHLLLYVSLHAYLTKQNTNLAQFRRSSN